MIYTLKKKKKKKSFFLISLSFMATVLGKWAAAAIGGAALVIARPFAVAPQHLFSLATAHAAIAQASVEMPETLGVKSGDVMHPRKQLYFVCVSWPSSDLLETLQSETYLAGKPV